jgi:hypothetical protein
LSYLILAAEVGYDKFLHRLTVDRLRGQPMGESLCPTWFWSLEVGPGLAAVGDVDWLRGQPMGESLWPTWFWSLEVGPGLAAVGR